MDENIAFGKKKEVWENSNWRKPKYTGSEWKCSAILHLSKLQVNTKYVFSAFVCVAVLKAELLC